MPPAISAPARQVPVRLLTAENFASFGTVIQNPLRDTQPGTTTLPSNAVYANQGSAVKVLDVTHMTNFYAEAPSQRRAKLVMNMFICSPRPLRQEQSGKMVNGKPISAKNAVQHVDSGEVPAKSKLFFDVKILERHPFTPQTFIPLGLDPSDPTTCYLVVVAPTLDFANDGTGKLKHGQPGNFLSRARASLSGLLPGSDVLKSDSEAGQARKGSGLPDLHNIRAFLAYGGQAVTYGAGTWHAPMVVLGTKKIDFVVVQYANGIADEDCQEVELHVEDASGVSIGLNVSPDIASSAELQAESSARAKL